MGRRVLCVDRVAVGEGGAVCLGDRAQADASCGQDAAGVRSPCVFVYAVRRCCHVRGPYARLVIADGERRRASVTVDLQELSCALLARLVTITDPAVIGQGRLLVRVHESRYATCVFRHPDDFWPESDEDLTHLPVLWTDGQELCHGGLPRPADASPRIADWLSHEL